MSIYFGPLDLYPNEYLIRKVQVKFAWLPRKCFDENSNRKQVWLKSYVEIRFLVVGEMSDWEFDRNYTEDAFSVLSLNGKLMLTVANS